MIETLRDLMAHKWHADALMLTAIRQNAAAAADPEILELLLHTLVSNRFWMLTVQGRPFDLEAESRAPASIDALIERYRSTQQEEAAWLTGATETDLANTVTHRYMPGSQFSTMEGLTQVCLHSQGHRSQIAKMFRRHGGQPPMTDYILWLVTRPAPEWSA